MSEREIRVRVGNVSLDVPECEDPATTRDIADHLTESLARIEKQSARIDTQAFLVRLAYEQAVLCHGLRAELEENRREFLRELDKVLSRLQTLRDEYQSGE